MGDAERVPALDGLRGIGVTAVLVGHITGADRVAHAGVTLFFAVSGYLITRLLLERPPLAAFWVRRAARLLPALLLMLAVTCAMWVGLGEPFWREAWPGLLYVADFTTVEDDGPFGHLWSLSVEEQWYAVWPLVMLTPWRRHIAAGTVAASLAWAATVGYDGRTLAPNLWPLALGALLALSGREPPRSPLDWRPLAWVGGISYALYLWHYPLHYAAAHNPWRTDLPVQLVAAAAAVVVAWVSTRLVEEPVRRWARSSGNRPCLEVVGISRPTVR